MQNLFKRQLAEIYLRLKPSMVIRQIIMHVQQRQRRSMKTIHVRSLKHILKTSAGMTIFSFAVRAGVEHIQWQYFVDRVPEFSGQKCNAADDTRRQWIGTFHAGYKPNLQGCCNKNRPCRSWGRCQ